MRPLSVCVVLVQDYTLLLAGACCCERKNNKVLVTKQGCQLTALKMQNLSGQYSLMQEIKTLSEGLDGKAQKCISKYIIL